MRVFLQCWETAHMSPAGSNSRFAWFGSGIIGVTWAAGVLLLGAADVSLVSPSTGSSADSTAGGLPDASLRCESSLKPKIGFRLTVTARWGAAASTPVLQKDTTSSETWARAGHLQCVKFNKTAWISSGKEMNLSLYFMIMTLNSDMNRLCLVFTSFTQLCCKSCYKNEVKDLLQLS